MRVIIVGGGIAGPVVATALHAVGIEAEVFEARPLAKETEGAFLGLAINGMRVLSDLGLLDSVVSRGAIPTPEIVFSSTTGKRLGHAPQGHLDDGKPSLTIMRGALQAALVEQARARGVRIHFDKRLANWADDGEKVTVRFTDDTTVTGDLLIGADGIGSAVRRWMMPDGPIPQFTGLLNVEGVVRDEALKPTPGEMHMVWGQRAFFGYTVKPNAEAWWFANVGWARETDRRTLDEVSSYEWRDRLCTLFAEDPPVIEVLVRSTDRIRAYPIYDLPALPSWRDGRAVLIGDAAHAMSPSSGQGAAMACEDAVVLASCLRDYPTIEKALARYEATQRPRVEQVVALGRRRGEYKAVESNMVRALRDLLLPVIFRFFASEKSMSWLLDHRVNWSR